MVLLYSRYIVLGRGLASRRLSTSSCWLQSRTLFRADQISCGAHSHKPTHLHVKLIVNRSQIQRIHSAAAGLSGATFKEDGSRQFSTSTSLLQSTNTPNDDRLIYKGEMNIILKILKIFSLTTSLLGCTILPVTLWYNENTAVNVIVTGLASLTIFTPLLLQWATKGYATHLYFNQETDTYTACTYTLFLRTRKLQFTPDDVKVPAVANIFTSFLAKGKPLLVDDAKFFNPNDVMHLKGYDKLQQKLTVEQLKQIYQSEESGDKQQ